MKSTKSKKLKLNPSFIIKDSCQKVFKVDYVPETKKWHCNGSTTFYGYSFEEIQKMPNFECK